MKVHGIVIFLLFHCLFPWIGEFSIVATAAGKTEMCVSSRAKDRKKRWKRKGNRSDDNDEGASPPFLLFFSGTGRKKFFPTFFFHAPLFSVWETGFWVRPHGQTTYSFPSFSLPLGDSLALQRGWKGGEGIFAHADFHIA